MLPAIGQGALALEARADDARVVKLCRALADPAAEVTTTAERALLAGLGVGCRTPVAGHATLAEGRLTVRGLVGRPDASEMIRETLARRARRTPPRWARSWRGACWRAAPTASCASWKRSTRTVRNAHARTRPGPRA